MERRAWPRTLLLGSDGLAAARLMPGRSVRLLNLSSGGALIETDCRLLPGAQVELQLAGGGRVSFAQNNDGTYTTYPGAQATLVRSGSGTAASSL